MKFRFQMEQKDEKHNVQTAKWSDRSGNCGANAIIDENTQKGGNSRKVGV
ncbi:MAG: hypothetical protein ACLR8L_00360 [Oscillospiraceae bacterium]